MAERKSFVEKAAEWSKKIDYFLIGSGIVLFYFIPGVGAALTIVPASKLEQWAKKRKQKN